VEAFNNRGNALKDLQRFEEALADYDRAIAASPDFTEAHYNRGVALLELKKPDEALASYDRAIALKPDYGRSAVQPRSLQFGDGPRGRLD